ncbi:hypothetical protein [Burkholderia sp. Ac-20365]|uniref:hypothetical protein n=1 Tax=Burkholderia sp. Ac-20365 TaxID=2703897 RepID=UPI00197CA548|nr:hypothetical protein [Burkholderia sp. Ac-20365]MBN3760951.1 hypothetical protein [Burkholderia sp. Ac-20365]
MNPPRFGPRTFLIGPHGSGKSSLGRALAQHGYEHLSIGTLARLIKRKRRPSDIPGRLILELARHEPGTPLAPRAATVLIEFLRQRPRIAVDGFPATAEHLQLLGDLADWSFVYVHTPRQNRETRLIARAETTPRGWTPGRKSERDLALPALCQALRGRTRLHFFDNAQSPLIVDAAELARPDARLG